MHRTCARPRVGERARGLGEEGLRLLSFHAGVALDDVILLDDTTAIAPRLGFHFGLHDELLADRPEVGVGGDVQEEREEHHTGRVGAEDDLVVPVARERMKSLLLRKKEINNK